jgi:hypothetical protein
MKYRTIIFSLVLALQFVPQVYAQCEVSKTLERVIATQYRGWRITELKDLPDWAQTEWRDKSVCPGIARGAFKKPGKDLIAILLFRKCEDWVLHKILLFDPKNEGSDIPDVLMHTKEVDRVGEIEAVTKANGLSGLLFAIPGSGSALFSWDGHRFRSKVVSF